MKILHVLFFVITLLMSINGSSASPPEIINIRQNHNTVGLCVKFEASLVLKCEFINPFDPDDVDINAVFTSPSGKKWTITGFYNLSGGTLWKIRYSHNEKGQSKRIIAK